MAQSSAGIGMGGLAAGAVVAVVAVGGAIWFERNNRTVDTPEVIEQVAVTQTQAPVIEQAPDAAPEAAPEIAPEPEIIIPAPPQFDTVRIEADGTSVIAGRIEGRGVVDILLDGLAIYRTETAGDGSFVAFVTIAPSDQPRILSLVADPDGAAIVSDETLIIAAAQAPAPVETADVTAEAPIEEAAAQDPVETAQADDAQVEEAEAEVAEAEPTAAAQDPAPQAADAASVAEVAITQAPQLSAPQVDDTLPSAEVEVALAEPQAAEQPSADPQTAAVAEPVAAPAQEAEATDPVIEQASGEATEQAREQATEQATAQAADTAPAAEPDAAVVAQTAPAPEPQPAAEPAAPQVLIADQDGVRVLQSSSDTPPEVLANLSLDTISYEPTGDVVLAGRATTDGFVRVYLDNLPVMEGAIDDSRSWRVVLAGIEAGVYTLRVDQIGEDGTVVSRIETPFLREEIEAVAAVLADKTEQDDFVVAQRTVEQGNTLWAIAREKYGDGILYVHVYEANKDQIRDPDLIYPGQIFVLPELDGAAN